MLGDISPTILTKLTSPAPLLEKLVLEDSRFRNLGPIPDDFLGARAPMLEYLKMEDLAIPNYELFVQFPSLTDLEISETHPRETHLRMEDLLQTLQQLPRLESLTLSNCVPKDVDHTFPTPSIVCPALRTLSLNDSIDPIRGLLGSLQIHKDTSVAFNLVFTKGTDHITTLNRFLADLATTWITGIGVEELAVDDCAPLDSLLQFRFYPIPRTEIPSSKAQLKIAFRGLEDDDLRQLEPELLGPFLSALAKAMVDLTPLRVPRIKSETDFTTQQWGELFGSLPHLQEIIFDVAELRNFFGALTDLSPLGAIPCFPSLSKLTVRHLPFWDPNANGDFGTAFVEALKVRPKSHRITSLHVVDDDDSSWKQDRLAPMCLGLCLPKSARSRYFMGGTRCGCV